MRHDAARQTDSEQQPHRSPLASATTAREAWRQSASEQAPGHPVSPKAMLKRNLQTFRTLGIFSRDNFDPQSQCRFGMNAQQLEDDFFRSRARHPAFGRDAERGPHLRRRGDPPPCSFGTVRIVDKPQK